MREEFFLREGRRVEIHEVRISPSTAGILEGHPDRIRKNILRRAPRAMGRGRNGYPEAYVVVPPEPPWLPKWRICAELHSDPLPDPAYDDWDGSSVVMVFFYDDLSEAPLTELVAAHLAGMDERRWKEHATNWGF